MKLNTLLSASLLMVLVAGALAQDTGVKLSYRGPAAPASSILEKLSQKAGVNLTAAVTLRDSVLYLRLKDATLDETMKHIADVLNAEWTKTNDGYMLGRGSNLVEADRRNETNAKVAALQKQIDEMRESVTKAGPWNEAAAKKISDEEQKMRDDFNRQINNDNGGGRTFAVRGAASSPDHAYQTPGGRAIVALLANMSPSQLATLVSNARTVFSTNATRMQIPMGNGGSRICEQFIKDQLLLAKASKTTQPPQEPGVTRRIVVNNMSLDGGSPIGPGNPALGVGVSMLVASRQFFGEGVMLTLVVADRNGQTLSTASMPLLPGQGTSEPIPTPKQGEQPIKLSPLAAEFAKLMDFGNGSGNGSVRAVRAVSLAFSGTNGTFKIRSAGAPAPQPTISAELRDAILNPEKVEPLTLGPSEAMDAVADGSDKNIVAYLPDSMLVPAARRLATPTTVPQFLAYADRMGIASTTEGNWTSLEPKAHISAESEAINRKGLGKILRSLDSKGSLRLDEIAAFALAQNKAPSDRDFAVAYMRGINMGFCEESFLPLGSNEMWGMVQLYAVLTPGQKQQLASDAGLRLGQVTTTQRNLVTSQVFSSSDGPVVTVPDDNERTMTLRAGAVMFGGPASVTTERTFVLPNGIPNNGILKMRADSETIAQGLYESGGTQVYDADGLAWSRAMADNPNAFGGIGGGNAEMPRKFRSGTQTNYSFTFQLAQNVSLTRELADLTLGNNGQAGAYEALPKDFRDKVDQKTSQLKEGFKNMPAGGFPGRNAPPPRP